MPAPRKKVEQLNQNPHSSECSASQGDRVILGGYSLTNAVIDSNEPTTFQAVDEIIAQIQRTEELKRRIAARLMEKQAKKKS